MRKWTPFVREPNPQKNGGVLFSNNRYHVIVYLHKNRVEGGPGVFHLSIRNNDRSAKRDWRDFQRIKNEFLGPEYEAVEVYPRESQLADMANQFHLWAFNTSGDWLTELGIGFLDGRNVWPGRGEKPAIAGTENIVQRPMEEMSIESMPEPILSEVALGQEESVT